MKWKEGVYTQVHSIVKGVEVVLKFIPAILAAMKIADEISQRLFGIEGVVTAGFDGKHKKGSKHYTGEAFDWRINHYDPEDVQVLHEALKDELGSDYDVVFHEGSHIHIEFDPK